MNLSFKDKETEIVYNRQFSKKLPQDIQHTALRKLVVLHNSITLNDLRIPSGNNLEQLHGDREGQYSIRINSQWRICFNWEGNNALNVEIVDYH
jgi:proteic killer suppression protein